MSPSRSDTTRENPIDPLRPGDHADSDGPKIIQPALGLAGWLRWAWRQLTSMRTAIVLLLFLAIAAVPGSLFPQRSADPNGVIQWERDNPDVFALADAVGLFDVYLSPWFSAIYLLLFTSLIGCVIPRARHHYKALRSQPPRTPARLSRLSDYQEATLPAGQASDPVEQAIGVAQRQLRRAGYRVQRYDGRGWVSVSAERGYLRETGNLLFHVALVGVLVSVAVGGSFAYTGQRVVVEGTTFVNALSDYSSFNPGRFIDGTGLAPYSLTLDDFQVSYRLPGTPGAGQAGDFAADVTIRQPGQDDQAQSVVVNYPITVQGDRIYLLGNGYAPTLTVRDAAGEVVFSESQPFLPQDSNMTSLGIIKIPDGLPEQLGLVGFFYPTQGVLPSGAFTSIYPDVINPVITFNVFSGDLGIDDGTPRSVYTLDVNGLTQHTGGDTGLDSLELTLGDTVDLPNGWGTVTWEIAGDTDPVKRFASLQIQRDPSSGWVLAFSILATLGLFAGLFVPRRRLWVKARLSTEGVQVEYAGLARGEDPALSRAVTDFAAQHATAYAVETAEGER
ncbi:cytochrome c biogenesis protein ResB [Microbacterium sp. NPDC006705]|uniref:Cytochrome c biogenesis protein ResB n=1 Tax=Microbacterium thalli TaxID=3027921 RepID=A0ABT5SL90_9MICO|nr:MULTISPECIES: cytochrome c biogenesis protein ResB [Microbacterium]MCZ4069137.1 cytochrome c biogenesis protein ResB [Microbacterium sp. H37-C3]MDD7928076.1 cytochrome c biogenesis protein ResB [Microbacterium thalli]MDD7963609.1 cytochrome c biogenesis protein ResB [Microbacterium thalli]MDN8550039.1 cytochrome c biogenesis protein ResB [Microbacterium thalli]WRK17211.1 cytochrome c biogenesis protein ResB [Microbacterium plantarum]